MRILSALLLFTAVSAQLLPPDLDLTVHEGSGQDTDSGGVPPTPSDTSASAADADKERRPTDDELIDGIFWPNYDITSQPILFFNNVRSGFEMAESRARHANKSRLEFVCYNEEEVVCLTEEMTQGDYRLRMVLVVDQAVVQSLNITFAVVVHEGNTTTGTDAGSIYKHKNYTTRFVAISDSGENEATTPTELLTNSTASEAPQLPAECPCKNGGMCKLSNTNPPENYCECTVDFFGAHCETKKETITMLTLVTTEPAVNQSSAPHFEQDAYDVVVPEGKNNEASTAAIIKYMSSASGSRQPNFTITSDTLEWFEIGGILQIPNEEKLVYAITLKLRAGIEVNRTQSGITDGLYSFALEASEPPYLTVAPISAEILSLDTKAQTSTVASSASTASEELQTTAEVEGESSTAEVDAVSSTIEVEEESSAATSTSPTEEEATSSAIETLETITEEVPTESTATPTPASTEISTATGTFSFTVPSDLEIGSEPGLSIDISGEKNGRIMVSEGLNQDDYVPEFKVIVNLMDKSKQVSNCVPTVIKKTFYVLKSERI
uniref:EGF-like domain-containing protein n=1 Tax=Plectus sambesii TaxID=2011161 RepID=A0A914X3K4_9BILA